VGVFDLSLKTVVTMKTKHDIVRLEPFFPFLFDPYWFFLDVN
jgi:hypothetical protein